MVGSGGGLTEAPGFPRATGPLGFYPNVASRPVSVAFSPLGGLLAIANRDQSTVALLVRSQAITFPALGPFGPRQAVVRLAATASSGLPVTYTVTTGPCRVSGTTLILSGDGACVVAAHQAGNADYPAAPDVSQTITRDGQPPTCRVTASSNGPPARTEVTVQDAVTGLRSITNIHIADGTVAVASFAPGTIAAVVVTITKTAPSRPTVWAFDATDMVGNSARCTGFLGGSAALIARSGGSRRTKTHTPAGADPARPDRRRPRPACAPAGGRGTGR